MMGMVATQKDLFHVINAQMSRRGPFWSFCLSNYRKNQMKNCVLYKGLKIIASSLGLLGLSLGRVLVPLRFMTSPSLTVQ